MRPTETTYDLFDGNLGELQDAIGGLPIPIGAEIVDDRGRRLVRVERVGSGYFAELRLIFATRDEIDEYETNPRPRARCQ